jgi:hypothetical protein
MVWEKEGEGSGQGRERHFPTVAQTPGLPRASRPPRRAPPYCAQQRVGVVLFRPIVVGIIAHVKAPLQGPAGDGRGIGE